ncbi:MAG: hypothetical protein HY914_16160 [Desulfomonile tiedjei]|nr:hypothetical protein [Desulfomonile tiedjei]
MEEHQLTKKQREWLQLSKKIGPGPMTRSEREALEKLYAELLPREQQDLKRYLDEKLAQKQPQEPVEEDDPIAKMEERVWAPPSHALRSALSKAQSVKTRKPERQS